MNSSAKHLRGRRESSSGDDHASAFGLADLDRTELGRRLADFAIAIIRSGEAALLATTRSTRFAIEAALEQRYFARAAAERDGSLYWLEAEEIARLAKPERQSDQDSLCELLTRALHHMREHQNVRPIRVWEESTALVRDRTTRRRLLQWWAEFARREHVQLATLRDIPNLSTGSAHESGQRLAYSPEQSAHAGVDEDPVRAARDRERVERELESRIARLEQQSRAAQAECENLRRLFVQSPALIVILRGPEHVCDFVNTGAAKLLGRDDLVGQSLRQVLPEMAERVAAVDRVYQTGERYVADNLSAVRDWNGNERPCERFFNVVYEPYRAENGEVEGVMLFGFEVSEQVLANRKIEAIVQELEIANRTKDEFLAMVSHELRTPLNAILGWVRMLRSNTLGPEKQARALETIDRNASAQAQLIEDLLDVSRIVSGKLRLDVSAVDVGRVVDEAIDSVRPAAAAKGLQLRQTIDPNAGPILGDPDRLRQVVWNLLTNAVKFTPKGGSVHVSVHKLDSAVHITVSDTGQGIAAEFVDNVFQQFRQADCTTTRKHGGLGLGLAIVRSLVELHGGSVRAHSEGVGKGASFVVSLPISPLRTPSFERPPALRLVQTSTFHPHAELAGVHVLVLDDEDDARNLLAEILSESGARVSTASSVANAMRFIESERPDVIVSDIGMPEQDGYDFIRQLRSLPASSGGRTPAVALTAYCRVEDRTKALAAGFNMHAPKPVEPAELIAGLASLAALFERN